jgi:NADH:ubiquinone oxidoreductase subunit E
METKQTLYICMGSACHQSGVYDVLPRLQQLIIDHGVESQIELKGAFCLGVCAQGVVLKLDDAIISDVNRKNVAKKFADEILSRLKGAGTDPQPGV